MLGQIVDWFYGQIVGFLGNFFSEMGNMGAELFAMSWVQSVVLFFSYLGWALFAIGLVVAPSFSAFVFAFCCAVANSNSDSCRS